MNNRGFSIVAATFIISIFLAIAGIAWFIYANGKISTTNNKTPQVASSQETTSEQDINKEFKSLKNVKTYKNNSLGLSFEYPANWEVHEASDTQRASGAIITLVSTGSEALPELYLSRWGDINSEAALGGNWGSERHYANLEDYITDPSYGLKKSLDTKNYTGQKLHIVTIGGHSESYGIMFENKNGIYEFKFNNVINAKHTTPETNHIVTTIKVY